MSVLLVTTFSSVAINASTITASDESTTISHDVGGLEPRGSVWPTVAGLFAWLALFISIWEIAHHLMHYNKPYLQKYVIRYVSRAIGS